MLLLHDVFANYLATKIHLHGKAENVRSPDQLSLLDGLPQFFHSVLEKQRRSDEFKVMGSIGNGNLARVPWVGIFNRKVTTSAQNGYYIVLLFSVNMKSCYLSLNQGVTAFQLQYSRKLALRKMRIAASRSLRHFSPDLRAHLGEIELAAHGGLGEGYEQGAIESYRYDSNAPPDENQVEEDFLTLLAHYDSLISVAGQTLQTLTPVNEAEFQHVVLTAAGKSSKNRNRELELAIGGEPVPLMRANFQMSYPRSVKVSAEALQKAHFKCEIDNAHKTFVSNAKQRPYVEAHHLIPLSQQSVFNYSLDVLANVVALCAHCHKLLHHGKANEKRQPLIMLLENRIDELKVMNIALDLNTLLSYYGEDMFDDEW